MAVPVLTLFLAATLRGQQQELEGWGRFEDPTGEATVAVESEALLITSGRNSVSFENSLDSSLRSLPRLSRDFSADFDLRLHISGSFSPKQKAVLIAAHGSGNYVWITSGLGLYRASLELSSGSIVNGQRVDEVTKRPRQLLPPWIRMRRIADELHSYYSADGRTWLHLSSANLASSNGDEKLPVQLILSLDNRQARNPLTVKFSQLQIQEGDQIRPIVVAEDPVKKTQRLRAEAQEKRARANLLGTVFSTIIAFGWCLFLAGLGSKGGFQFSIRRMLALVALVGATLSVTGLFVRSNADSVGHLLACIPLMLLAIGNALAAYAAFDPWCRCPRSLLPAESPFAVGPAQTGVLPTVLALVFGTGFLLLGGFAAVLLVEDNWTMDTGGASSKEWLMGLPFIAATMIGSFARGASLVGFVALMFGARLGRGFAKYFGLCGGSFLSLMLWEATHESGRRFAHGGGMWNAWGNLVTGFVGLGLLAFCLFAAVWLTRRVSCFGRRARRRAGRLYLVGMLAGAGLGMLPELDWLFFAPPPLSAFFGAMIGASFGLVAGILTAGDRLQPSSETG